MEDHRDDRHYQGHKGIESKRISEIWTLLKSNKILLTAVIALAFLVIGMGIVIVGVACYFIYKLAVKTDMSSFAWVLDLIEKIMGTAKLFGG
jgi:ABC-type transport system involved in cytochrome bd biosynthesis fused ATPase/permease subunit